VKKQKLDSPPFRDATDSPPKAVSIQATNLQKSHEEFEQFLDVVSSDLSEKIEQQKLLKHSVNIKDKGYAGVQTFMLIKYKSRIERFRNVSRGYLADVLVNDSEGANSEQQQQRLTRHSELLGKMKRRIKQILDVSDRYAVQDIFDNINLVTELSEALQPSKPTSRMEKCKSVSTLDKVQRQPRPVSNQENWAGDWTDTASSSGQPDRRPRKMNTFRSLTDHLAVLTKTYTNRK